jgi:hypothetical protein
MKKMQKSTLTLVLACKIVNDFQKKSYPKKILKIDSSMTRFLMNFDSEKSRIALLRLVFSAK